MAFKGLEDRFLARASEIYNQYSTRDGGPDAGRNDVPYLEWKPDSPTAREQTHDTRFIPTGAVKRDLSRIFAFSKSNDGLLFLGKQQLQQTGNAFSETRIINPLFVLDNVVPGSHARRSLTGTASFNPKGDLAHCSPASRDPKISGAGRLQKETADAAKAQATGTNNSLLGNFTAGRFLDSIKGFFSLSQKGSLAIDDRPELNVNGEYYSIAMWKGFQKNYGSRGAVEDAKASLRVGDVRGAVDALKNAGNLLIKEAGLNSLARNVKVDGRAFAGAPLEGARYFITGTRDADRYLTDSVNGNGNTPEVQTAYLNRQPYFLTPYVSSVPGIIITMPEEQARTKAGLIKGLRTVGNFFGNNPVGNLVTEAAREAELKAKTNAGVDDSESASTDHMLFPDLALENRYLTDTRLAYLRDHLNAQIANGLSIAHSGSSYFTTKNSYAVPGRSNNVNPRSRAVTGGYLSDPMNLTEPVLDVGEKSTVRDIIRVSIEDVVNKKFIPLRAFVTGIKQTTNTDVSDTQYIGRTERNIVYVGVRREISFTLKIHAFSKDELDNVWTKINYLTALCYPSKYDNGFLVPPMAKLTLGDMYKNQPGILRSVSHDVEDGTSWEITEGRQVPHGITLQIAFTVIDKKQHTAANSGMDGFFSLSRTSQNAVKPSKDPKPTTGK
jgi:hypothetical protein